METIISAKASARRNSHRVPVARKILLISAGSAVIALLASGVLLAVTAESIISSALGEEVDLDNLGFATEEALSILQFRGYLLLLFAVMVAASIPGCLRGGYPSRLLASLSCAGAAGIGCLVMLDVATPVIHGLVAVGILSVAVMWVIAWAPSIRSHGKMEHDAR